MNTIAKTDYFFEKIATSYRDSCVVFAALELDVFGILRDFPNGASVEDVSQVIGQGTKVVDALLKCLVHKNALDLTKDNLFLLNANSKLIAEDPKRKAGLLHYKDEIHEWLNLGDKIKNKLSSKVTREEEVFTTERIEPYLDMVRSSNVVRANTLFRKLKPYLPEIQHGLDLGGGHGLYSEKLCEHYPMAQVTIADLAPAIEYANKYVQSDYRHRIHLKVEDARSIDINSKYDFAMLNDLLHSFDYSEKKNILKRTVNGLVDGGYICVSKFKLNRDAIQEEVNNYLFSLKMFVNSRSGYLAYDEEIIDILTLNGCRLRKVIEIENGMPSVAILAQKTGKGSL